MSEIKQLEADYLIIGAGAMGLAFADELLKHDKQASIVFAERRGMSGGHWVDAYDHVKLHQPAIAYGVNSLELSESKTDLSSRPQ
ncbi:NAD(P)-binding protein, partial [Oleiphilus sp. HI0066]|uniref:NAD(P)-binding protein n=3 Tax=Oleiphilus TaxID=141450 RepID=UPI000A68B487